MHLLIGVLHGRHILQVFSAQNRLEVSTLCGAGQEPEDIGNMLAHQALDRARNMTGGTYHVDGGMVLD